MSIAKHIGFIVLTILYTVSIATSLSAQGGAAVAGAGGSGLVMSPEYEKKEHDFIQFLMSRLEDDIKLELHLLSKEEQLQKINEKELNIYSLSDNNKKLFQQLIESKIKYGINRSLSGVEFTNQTKEAISNSNRISRLSFYISHIAVLIGFIFALVEFFHAYRLRRRGVASGTTELNLGLESIAIKTTSIGVILLVFSITFYFIFIKYVYPLKLDSM